jgi:rubrerythrin
LAQLARSLQENGQFIEYETRAVEQFAPLTTVSEAVPTEFEALKDQVSVLSRAIENEKTARERYRVLAEETSDPDGQDMFHKLANEEMIHQRILEDEFFSLSNKGVWGWSGMYGE